MTNQQTVLLASRDPHQAELRRSLLEQAGFRVLSALDFSAVEKACSEGNVAGVVIGWSVAIAEKRRVWQKVRETCGVEVPIVELLRGNKAELLPDRALFAHEWNDQQFADMVSSLFKPN